MTRTEALAFALSPLTRQRRPVRLSRINDALTAAGHEPTDAEEVAALVGPQVRGAVAGVVAAAARRMARDVGVACPALDGRAATP